eukprot:765071-Hanusia_phi.AAC.1
MRTKECTCRARLQYNHSPPLMVYLQICKRKARGEEVANKNRPALKNYGKRSFSPAASPKNRDVEHREKGHAERDDDATRHTVPKPSATRSSQELTTINISTHLNSGNFLTNGLNSSASFVGKTDLEVKLSEQAIMETSPHSISSWIRRRRQESDT